MTRFSLAEAMWVCLKVLKGKCNAVTCSAWGGCTVRGCAMWQRSPSGETTYFPGNGCYLAASIQLDGNIMTLGPDTNESNVSMSWPDVNDTEVMGGNGTRRLEGETTNFLV